MDERCAALARDILTGREAIFHDAPPAVLVASHPGGMSWLVSSASLPSARRAAEALSSAVQVDAWRGLHVLRIAGDVPSKRAREAATEAGLALVKGDALWQTVPWESR